VFRGIFSGEYFAVWPAETFLRHRPFYRPSWERMYKPDIHSIISLSGISLVMDKFSGSTILGTLFLCPYSTDLLIFNMFEFCDKDAIFDGRFDGQRAMLRACSTIPCAQV
jgi:hypothetical protein